MTRKLRRVTPGPGPEREPRPGLPAGCAPVALQVISCVEQTVTDPDRPDASESPGLSGPGGLGRRARVVHRRRYRPNQSIIEAVAFYDRREPRDDAMSAERSAKLRSTEGLARIPYRPFAPRNKARGRRRAVQSVHCSWRSKADIAERIRCERGRTRGELEPDG